jgi:hypothetical protein
MLDDVASELHPFRQLRGGQAQLAAANGETVRVTAIVAVAAGLRIERLHEIRAEAGGVPRSR